MKTLWDSFCSVVDNFNGNVAIVDGDTNITYAELDSLVREYAREISRYDDDIVGLIADQNYKSVIIILATIFTGKTIAPIDPRLPDCEIESKLMSLTNKVISENARLIDGIEQILIEDISKSKNKDDSNVSFGNERSAYILHTSGSTGIPKPVLASAKSLKIVSEELAKRYYIDNTSKVIQFAYLSFDSSFVEVWSTILAGGTLIIPGKLLREDLYGTLETVASKYNNLTITLPPSVSSGLTNKTINSISTLILAGEELPIGLANFLFGKIEHLINAYGPTESIICATTYEIRSIQQNRVPIGKPLSGMRIFIDKDGEMILTSSYLAEGYFGIISEAFEKDKDGLRRYKTGDFANIDDEGNYIFLGRRDNQIKIYGQRIELEGVESIVRGVVSDSRFIVIYEQGLYGVTDRTFDVNEALSLANSKLPKNINLIKIFKLDSLPLDFNGKLDRKKIKEYVLKELAAHNNNRYETIIRIWLDAFRRDVEVDMETGFFELGGDSLIALRLVSLINNHYGVNIRLSDIIKNNASPRIILDLLKKAGIK